jgi:hypothetical protein
LELDGCELLNSTRRCGIKVASLVLKSYKSFKFQPIKIGR